MRTTSVILFAFVASCSFAVAQETPLTRVSIREWIKNDGKAKTIARAEKDERRESELLVAAKKARISKSVKQTKVVDNGATITVYFPSTASRDIFVEVHEKLLRDARRQIDNPMPYAPKMYVDKLVAGHIGFLASASTIEEYGFRCVQVIDEHNALVQMRGETDVIGTTGALKGAIVSGIYLWVQMPTTGMLDGKFYNDAPRIFEVVGTKRYRTADGSSTVMHVRTVDLSELITEASVN